jgi:hypothetical protein
MSETEKLQQENERLRKALKEIATHNPFAVPVYKVKQIAENALENN